MESQYRSRIKWCILMVFVITIVAVIFSQRKNEKYENKKMKIGISAYKLDEPFITSIYSEMETLVPEIEEKTGSTILLKVVDPNANQGTQNNQIDEYIRKKYDVICVNLVDKTAAAFLIHKAKTAEIPIIFFNTEPVEEDMNLWSHTYYVGSDSKKSGQLAGELVLRAYRENPLKVDKNNDGKIQYVMIEGEQAHQDTILRTKYSVEAIQDGGIEVEKLDSGTASWMRTPAYELMMEWIKKYGKEIEVVISNNDEMAIGAIEAIQEYIMMSPIVVGTNGTDEALELIEKGFMYGTVKNDAKIQAEKIMNYAVEDCIDKKKIENRSMKINHTILVKGENGIQELKEGDD